MAKLCEKCEECDAQEGITLCEWCLAKQRFAVFAKSCGLTLYPDPTGERYIYRLDGGCEGKKSEYVEFIDVLWNALVEAKGGDKKLLIGDG